MRSLSLSIGVLVWLGTMGCDASGASGRDGKAGREGQDGLTGPAGPAGPREVLVDATGMVIEGAVGGRWFDADGYIWLIDMEEGRPYAPGAPLLTGDIGGWYTSSACDESEKWYQRVEPRLVHFDPDVGNIVRADDALSVELGFGGIPGLPETCLEQPAPILGVAASDMEDAPDDPDVQWAPPLRYEYAAE